MPNTEAAPFLDFSDRSAWEEWLQLHAESSPQAWLRIGKAKKASGLISIADAGDSALCFGWIDSHRRSYDESSFLQRYSPRRAGSPWSRVNVLRAEALVAAKRMRPAGHSEIDAARQDGRWETAYEPQRDVVIPEDFAAALKDVHGAEEAFEKLGKTARYSILLPILKAKGEATRRTRIGKAVRLLSSPLDVQDESNAGVHP